MKFIPRLIAAASLAALACTAQAAVVMSAPSLSGFVSISGFNDATPNTYTIAFRDLQGTLTLNNLAAGNYATSVQGSGSFTGFDGPGGTIAGSLLTPFSVFSGALANSGLLLPTYTFGFTPGVVDQNDTLLANIAFGSSYNGVMDATLFATINGLAGGIFSDASGAGSLDITGQIFSDGMIFNVTETANWFFNRGFAGLYAAADAAGGGGNGIIDGTFSMEGVSVNANRIPEPGSLALAGLALAGLGFARRRRVAASA